MLTPSKYIPFDKSIISKMLALIEGQPEEVLVVDLYREHANHFDGIDEFMFALDVLYVLNKIEINFEEGILRYVG